MCVSFFIVGDNMNYEYYMNIALKEAKKAYIKDDVPVGCIIVKNNKVIAKAYNKKENKNVAIYHAEIIAIEKACKKLKTWHLENCVLYTTLEPCLMCCGAIHQSRIKKVIYGTKNITCSGTKYINDIDLINIENGECSRLLKKFFKMKRK